MTRSLFLSGAMITAVAMIMASPSVADTSGLIIGPIDRIWIIDCIVLVLLMKVGFLMLEAGASRQKNSINAAFKNLAALIICFVLFLVFGYRIAFGWDLVGPVAIGSGALESGAILVMMYQAVFCTTAAAIISGAVCERFSLKAYIATCGFVALLVYPMTAHWVYGALFFPEAEPWLARLGFIDWAGASVVHGVGAWMALAALIFTGPRLGRFDPETGQPRYLDGYSPVLSMAGTLVLLIGWMGFNGGAGLTFDDTTSKVISNTVLAGLWGGGFAMIIVTVMRWKPHPNRAIEGTIAGLVSVTAAPHLLSFAAVLIVVSIGVVVSLYMRSVLLRFQIDDVVNVVATHGIAGVVGTLAVAFAVPGEALPAGSTLNQLGVQAAGVSVIFAWTFSLGLLWFFLLKQVMQIRVDRLAETRGLNVSEHRVAFGAERFANELERLITDRSDPERRISLPDGDQNERLAHLFNRMLDELAAAHNATRSDLDGKVAEAKAIANILEQVSEGDLDIRIDAESKPEEFQTIAIGVNQLLDILARNIGQIASSASEVAVGCDNLTRISNDLYERSASQIDSVQAITFKLNSMADASKDNATQADEALGVARESREAADGVSSSLNNIRTAMEGIVASTSKIEPIVDLIEDIGFQTTLLALNASVVAARAGEHGKSFSVVADEVRKLANSVQSSAADIRSIVDEASRSVDGGATAIGGTVEHVANIGSTATRVSSQIEQIHSSSTNLQNQLTGLGEVVEQITVAASANAALASETSDGADGLSRLGHKLLATVGSFDAIEPEEDGDQDEDEDDETEATGTAEGGAFFF